MPTAFASRRSHAPAATMNGGSSESNRSQWKPAPSLKPPRTRRLAFDSPTTVATAARRLPPSTARWSRRRRPVGDDLRRDGPATDEALQHLHIESLARDELSFVPDNRLLPLGDALHPVVDEGSRCRATEIGRRLHGASEARRLVHQSDQNVEDGDDTPRGHGRVMVAHGHDNTLKSSPVPRPDTRSPAPGDGSTALIRRSTDTRTHE
ncbi:hypothetical protein RN51_01945 [Microbacterium oxydans]|uniref:Uncharacterized protein n=1 Tax=Microbacterium oxydans TaxID=82380 RepID=A0A0F0KS40_9MICO|nr:hypothetical protein RN51_01945 [Microbacterium oxydans]